MKGKAGRAWGTAEGTRCAIRGEKLSDQGVWLGLTCESLGALVVVERDGDARHGAAGAAGDASDKKMMFGARGARVGGRLIELII